MKDVNHDIIIDTLLWYKVRELSGYNPTLAKQKLLRKPRRAYRSSWSRQGNQKSFTLTIPWNLAKPVKIFPGVILRQHRTDRKPMGLLRQQYAESWKGHLPYCCNQVWTKNGGRIPWNATALCEIFRISCLMGRHPMKGVSECPLTDQWYRLEQWSKITPFMRKTYRDYINLVQKSCQVYSSVMSCMREDSGKETLWSQTLKNWRRWTHLNSTPGTSMQRKCWRQWKVKVSLFPVADGTVKISGGDQNLRTSTLIRDSPDRGEEQDNLRGESEASSSTPRQDSSWYDGDARNDFWSIWGDVIYRHHVEPRVKLHVPREASYPNPLKYIDVTRTTDTTLDVMSEKHIEDHWNVDGERELTVWMHGQVTKDSLYWVKSHRMDIHGPEGTNDLQARHFVARNLGNMSDASKRKSKQKWPIEKPKLDNATRLRGIYFIDPDEEFKDIMKNARRKLEIPMPAAMLCKLQWAEVAGKLSALLEDTRQNTLVLLKLTNLWKSEWKELLTDIMKITLQEEVRIHQVTPVHKFIPTPQAMKIPDAKAAVEKAWDELEKIPAWRWLMQGMRAE